jgi:hypothetical protein
VDMWLTRAATLRAGFDDSTCGALVRATMAADLSSGDDLLGRLTSRMEQSFAKLFFVQNFANRDRAAAARVGIDMHNSDYAWAGITLLWVTARIQLFELAARVPVVKDRADRYLVDKLLQLLEQYGHPEYSSHAEAYRPVQLEAAS